MSREPGEPISNPKTASDFVVPKSEQPKTLQPEMSLSRIETYGELGLQVSLEILQKQLIRRRSPDSKFDEIEVDVKGILQILNSYEEKFLVAEKYEQEFEALIELPPPEVMQEKIKNFLLLTEQILTQEGL